MEPSAEAYIFMDKRQYAESINDRLEPRGFRDLIFQQFLERTQKPAEIFDLYFVNFNCPLGAIPLGNPAFSKIM